MNAQRIFENRKARLLREFDKTFPGETPPTTDEEVLYWLDEEQFVVKQRLIERYKAQDPEGEWPETRDEIELFFNKRDLYHEVNWASKSGDYDRLDRFEYIVEQKRKLMDAQPEIFAGRSDEEANMIFVHAYLQALETKAGGGA